MKSSKSPVAMEAGSRCEFSSYFAGGFAENIHCLADSLSDMGKELFRQEGKHL